MSTPALDFIDKLYETYPNKESFRTALMMLTQVDAPIEQMKEALLNTFRKQGVSDMQILVALIKIYGEAVYIIVKETPELEDFFADAHALSYLTLCGAEQILRKERAKNNG